MYLFYMMNDNSNGCRWTIDKVLASSNLMLNDATLPCVLALASHISVRFIDLHVFYIHIVCISS